MGELTDPLEELLRRTKITKAARHKASERLKRHHKLSQWTVTIISTALIFVPLLQALSVQTPPYTAAQLNVIQTILAVAVLVYSLLLGQENFQLRAEKMHANAVELGTFARKLAGIIAGRGAGGSFDLAQYELLRADYARILETNENHEPIDYALTQLSVMKGAQWLFQSAWVRSRYLFVFSHYMVASVLTGWFLLTLLPSLRHTS